MEVEFCSALGVEADVCLVPGQGPLGVKVDACLVPGQGPLGVEAEFCSALGVEADVCLIPGQGPLGVKVDACLVAGQGPLGMELDVCLHTTPLVAFLLCSYMHGSLHMGGLAESSVGYECVVRRNSFIFVPWTKFTSDYVRIYRQTILLPQTSSIGLEIQLLVTYQSVVTVFLILLYFFGGLKILLQSLPL